MINGVYSEPHGIQLNIEVFFPTLMALVRLPFVIDTGAVVTSISQDDVARLGQEALQNIPFRPGRSRMAGIGGDVLWSQFDGALLLQHENGGSTTIAQPLAVLSAPGTPSLLGRDILALGVLTLDGPNGRVSFDLPVGFIR